MKADIKSNIYNLLPVLIIPALWFILHPALKVPEYILPTPGRIMMGLIDFVSGRYGLTAYSGRFWEHSIASIIRVAQGFFLALLFGVPLGIMSGRSKAFKRIFETQVHIVRMIPGIGWLPIAMVWFGVGNKTTVFLIALAAFFPIYINTNAGVMQVSEKIIHAAMMLGAKGLSLFTHVIIPAAAPGILSGMRLGLGISWAYLVLGELTGVSKGLGAVMMDARMLGNVDVIIICMIAIAFWGRITDRILVYIIGRLHPAKEVLNHE